MQIKMLVSFSDSTGNSARLGEVIEVLDEQAQQMIADGRAEAVNAEPVIIEDVVTRTFKPRGRKGV